MKLNKGNFLFRNIFNRIIARQMSIKVRSEAERHQELLETARSLLELLASPQEHLYFKRSYADEQAPDFDSHTYFEARGMIADEQTMSLLNDLLELYANALAHIGDFNLRQTYLSAPYLRMGADLAEASAQIAKLGDMFTENYELLRRFMTTNGMSGNIIPFHIKEEEFCLEISSQTNQK